MRDKMEGLIPFCSQLLTDEALKSKRDFWEPLILLGEGKTIEEIVQGYEEYEKRNEPSFGPV